MRWLLSLLLAWRIKPPEASTPHPIPEPPHTHVESPEPTQELICEVRTQGGASPSQAAKANLIVGGTSAALLQCHDSNTALIGGSQATPAYPTFRIRLKEGSPSSFQRLRYAYGGTTLGEFKEIPGTRIQLRFHSVGAGVHIFVPTTVPLAVTSNSPKAIGSSQGPSLEKNARLQLVVADTDGDASQYCKITTEVPGQPAEVSYRGDTGYATYTVLDSDPTVVHEATVNVYVAYFSNTGQNLPSPGYATVTTMFAPDPKSEKVETAPRCAFDINLCTSGLLFPFVSNQGGLDTRIALSNTSLDPFGSSQERGSVAFYFVGSSATGEPIPPAIVTETIPAGGQLVFDLSRGGNFGMPAVPGFQGYVIAVVNFRHCHAVALISGLGAETPASYLAVRIPSKNGYPDRSGSL